MSRCTFRFYWCIKVDKSISKNGEIFLTSDSIDIIDGDLVFKKEDGFILFTISKTNWISCYAASVLDGVPFCVDHWLEEGCE